MSAVLSKEVIERIRDANDIVEVISAYIPLKRAGGTFKALCPFHKEKTPSFTAHPQRQIFHCFGCGAGGDVFRFIMQYEGLDFPGAARRLADRAGIRVEWTEEDRRGEGPDKDALLKLHEDAATLYQQALLKGAEGEAARRYLQERALGEDVVRDFRIGYAPDRWDFLLAWAQKKGYPAAVLEASGLFSSGENAKGETRVYDRFRGRVMFPIRDELGRIIGFSGRVLKKDEKAAKYVNSPETPIFRKGRVMYGLDRARRSILEKRLALLCEGQIDVIRCHTAGFTHAVAAQGTALTEQHALLLKRYADQVVVVLDADPAGQNASLRSAELLLAAGLSVQIASLPLDEDPDSLILKKGADAFRAVLEAAQPLLDFQIGLLRQKENFGSEAGLMRATRAILETIGKAPTAVQRDHLLRQAAAVLKLDEAALRQDLRRHERSTAGAPAESGAPAAAPDHPRHEVELAESLLLHPETAEIIRRYVPLKTLTDSACRCIIEKALGAGGDLMSALSSADPEVIRLAAQIQLTPPKVRGEELLPENAVRDIILVIRRKDFERRRADVGQRLKKAKPEEQRALEVEYSQLTLDINALQQGWSRAQPILDLE